MSFRTALILLAIGALAAHGEEAESRLHGSYRKAPLNGWTVVHLEGRPADIGFQHGYLLAKEIAELQRIVVLSLDHDTHRPWEFYRKAAQEMLWPKIEEEYRDELQGIAEGSAARGYKMDVWDVVALNAWQELGGYYVPWLERKNLSQRQAPLPEHCSAFVANGSHTKDGRIVMGHNTWTGFLEGARWSMIFDIAPERGFHILMDGLPGLIHSGDDFGINSSGIMITETTISQFQGWDPDGIAEFVRARKAMQYADSIDSFARLMTEGNNGGYANNWLVGDRKSNEIASLELGLKNVTLQRSSDGYFVGSNFPVSERLAVEETTFTRDNKTVSANARHARWEQLMKEYFGQIDLQLAKKFLGDSVDVVTGRNDPDERTLCGRVDLSPRGLPGWMPPYGLAGAVQSKVVDSKLAGEMSFSASFGFGCGPAFHAASYLRQHKDAAWTKGLLKDITQQPWTQFSATH